VKPMLLSSLCFSKKVSQLQLRGHILERDSLLLTMRPSKEGIHTNMLCKFMLHRIIGNLYAPVLSQRRGVATSQETPKSANNHRSQTISAVVVARARSSASVLERDTAACFLDFHAIGEEPRRMQYPVMERRSLGSLAQVESE
jgi:hypothetical protein